MNELYAHIGPETDVPAGDIGVGGREIGYLFGQYKKLTRSFNGTLTGKGQVWGGSLLRPEATGYGVAYFTEEMLNNIGDSIKGKRVAISGFGNVAWGAVKKVNELGGKAVTLSGPDGVIYDPEGITGDKVDYMLQMRYSGRDEVAQYAERFGVEFRANRKPWEVPVDVALPCAIQNELNEDDAKHLIDNGCKAVVEGANMPTTAKAMHMLQHAGVLFAPGKAANAGGVACSGLEMSQNRMGMQWTEEEVDEKLHRIMRRIHKICIDSAEDSGHPGDYVSGANIGGFLNVARAMQEQGVY